MIKSELKKRDREDVAAEEAVAENLDLAEHCYEVAWKLEGPSPQAVQGDWLVLSNSNDAALVEAVCSRFKAMGAGGVLGSCGGGDVPVIADYGGLEAPAGLCILLSGSLEGPEQVRLAVQRGICTSAGRFPPVLSEWSWC